MSTLFSSPQLGSIVSLDLTEKHPEPESKNLLQWPGSSEWKILFLVSFFPCFLLKVSPQQCQLDRSYPLAVLCFITTTGMLMQNIIVLQYFATGFESLCAQCGKEMNHLKEIHSAVLSLQKAQQDIHR